MQVEEVVFLIVGLPAGLFFLWLGRVTAPYPCSECGTEVQTRLIKEIDNHKICPDCVDKILRKGATKSN